MSRKKTVTKRPSYFEGVQWIALSDNAGNRDTLDEIEGYISTLLLADLFGAEPRRVAVDIYRTRYKYLASEVTPCQS